MDKLITEHKAYNALAVLFQGEYRALEKTHRSHDSWIKSFDAARQNREIDADKEWQRIINQGVRLIMSAETTFPPPLREIPWPPFAFYAKGEFGGHEPNIAVVGTRKASVRGKAIAERFSRELAATGVTIVSGLALGIDRAAHEGALKAGGRTIAVLANGLDRVYPRQHEALAKNILRQKGALISEYPLDSPAYPHRFIERNRIVSGLAQGVLVVEAPAESGALATARFALEQNRDVFVVPGEVDNPNYAGSHELIKQGATLVTSSEDILHAIGIEPRSVNLPIGFENERARTLDETSLNIVTILKKAGAPLNLDQIAENAGMETPEASKTASLLILKGIIKEERGKYYL